MQGIKRNVLLILTMFFVGTFSAFAGNNQDSDTVDSSQSVYWENVMNAIIQVESNGNSKAKSGSSVGAMQITPLLVAECNNILRSRRSKKRYKLSDRLSVKKSKEMFLLIQSKYNPLRNIEQAIRSWNGGIHYSVQRTQRYLERVLSVMRANTPYI